MDKTIEIVVVAMIALVTALIVLFLVQGQTDSFGNFLDETKSNAKDKAGNSDVLPDSEQQDSGDTSGNSFRESGGRNISAV
ncbi:MAG: hypothetical protein ABEJ56_06765 [Candidatus Nanohaloarchaea archaeon]